MWLLNTYFLNTYYVLGIHAKCWEHKNESKTPFLSLEVYMKPEENIYTDNFIMIWKEQDIIETMKKKDS